jgi:hypothetical protein
MIQLKRFGWVLALAALVALVVVVNSANAQRRRGSNATAGGSSSSNQQNNNSNNNSNNDDDKKKKDSDQSSSGNSQSGQSSSNNNQSGQSNSSSSSFKRGSSSNSSNNSSSNNAQQGVQQFQQMIQGGGTGQGTQTMRGLRGQMQGQGQGQMRGRGQLNSQQVQKFQPWQVWQGNNNQNNPSNQKKSASWFVQLGGGPQPYSMGWYDSHPHAWHWNKNNYNDAWKIATAASVIGWLGWGQPHYNQTIIYEPVPVQTFIFDPNASGPWMVLGVYSLLTSPVDSGTRILQLSINQQGYLRGSYYDMITNETYNVRGRIDQPTQYAQWWIDTNQQLTFYTPISQLTQSQGTVNARLPGGTQQWQVVRMEYAQ